MNPDGGFISLLTHLKLNMLYKEVKLIAGQNLRYTGKGFPGFVNGLPYMTFVTHHNSTQYLVSYNNIRLIVNKRYLIAIS